GQSASSRRTKRLRSRCATVRFIASSPAFRRSMTSDVAIFGAGAWGTALAVHLVTRSARSCSVVVWTRSSEHAEALRRTRENARYLAGVTLPAALSITSDLDDALHARTLIVATPVAALLEVVDAIGAAGASAPVAWLS